MKAVRTRKRKVVASDGPYLAAEAPLHSQALMVLGMHRSGTSALTRVFSLLGADLPKNVLGAGHGNETGHWESTDLLAIHDEILAAAGTSWDDWRAFNPAWFEASIANDYRGRLLRALQADFSGSRLFLIKDPRTCRFAPLWWQVLKAFGARPSIVIPVRNPLEVAASLKTRNGFSASKSYLLWLRHVLDAERDSRGLPRAIVTYEGLLEDWRGVTTAVSQKTGVVWPRLSNRAELDVDRYLAAEHRHHTIQDSELRARADVTDWVKDAYGILRSMSVEKETTERHRRLDAIRADFDAASSAFGLLLTEEEDLQQSRMRERASEVSAITGELAATKATLEQVVQEQTRVAGALEAANADAAQSAAHLAALAGELERLRFAAQEQESIGAGLRAELEAVRSEAEQRRQHEVGELSGRLAASDVARDRLEGEIKELERQLGGARQYLRESQTDVQRLAGEAAATRQALEQSNSERERLEAALVEARRESEALRHAGEQATDRLTRELEATHSELADSQAEAKQIAAEIADARLMLEVARAEQARLAVALAESQHESDARYKATAQQKAQFEQELDTARRGLAASRAETADLASALNYDLKAARAVADLAKAETVQIRAERDAAQQDLQRNAHDLVEARRQAAASAAQAPALAQQLTAARASASSAQSEVVRRDSELAQSRRETSERDAKASLLERELGAARALLEELRASVREQARRLDEKPAASTWQKLTARFGRRRGRSKASLQWEYDVIRRSKLFDPLWYLKHNPDVAAASEDPLWHYIRHGAAEDRIPHPLFDPGWYRSQAADLVTTGLSPLAHYVALGVSKDLDPHPLFDTQWYRQQTREVAAAQVNPLYHFWKTGSSQRFDPHPLFDTSWYLEQNIDVARAGENPLLHYIAYGAKEGRNPHPNFDIKWYLLHNPDVAAAGVDPLRHYVQYGRAEGRTLHAVEANNFNDRKSIHFSDKPNEVKNVNLENFRNDFDSDSYLMTYPDVGDFEKHSGFLAFEHWLFHGFREGRSAPGLRPFFRRRYDQTQVEKKRPGVDYFGFFQEPTGLGAAARSYASAIEAKGLPVSRVTIDRNLSVAQAEPTEDQRSRIQILHLNADHFLRFFLDGGWVYQHNAYNVGLWVWELPSFRPDWAQSYGAVDEIWVPSKFCQRAIDSISPVPVYRIPHAVTVDRGKAIYSRSNFGIPVDCFVFAAIFDAGSQLSRKNPELLIRAFKEVFGMRRDVMLVLKCFDSTVGSHISPISRIKELIAGQENIRLFDRMFDERELVSFKALIDCYVSTHRSEGFGLNIAEAMALGKPVIATAYSGNMDYMNHTNSYPLDYKLVEIEESSGPYLKGNLWAEPSFEHLCCLLSKVINDFPEAKRLGNAAAADIAREYSLEAVGELIEARLSEIGAFSSRFDPPRTASAKSKVYTSRHPLACVSKSDRDIVSQLSHRPTISVLVPVYNVAAQYLEACVESVKQQSYPFWELVLYDDKSSNSETLETLARYKGTDGRIKVIYGETNAGIAEATNEALSLTLGEYVALLDNDDEITPDALLEIARAINENPDVDFLYSDEDKIAEDGSYCETYFKPDWSPEHLESCMYVLHMLVVKRELLLRLGGLRKKFDGSQDYDLALRLGKIAKKVVHIPKILYHWRKIPGSAAAVLNAKPWALDAAKLALEDYVKTGELGGIVEPGKLPGLYRVRWEIPASLVPTLVIFTDNRMADVEGRGHINLFDNFLTSLLSKTSYKPGFKILAVDNGNLRADQRDLIIGKGGKVISYQGEGSFNFSRKANFAFANVESDLVVMLNDDMEVIAPGWLEALVEFAQLPTTGAVGAKLMYPDGRIQHCGVVLGIYGNVAHVYHQAPKDVIGYNAYPNVVRNYLAVTGACLATRMREVKAIGGFDEALAVDYNDIDFCLKLHSRGLRNIYTPFAEMYHFEGVTQKRTTQNELERRLFAERWKKFMQSDPFYNVNLPKDRHDFEIPDIAAP